MRFIKSFFSSDPREATREKILELELGDTAIELPTAIDTDDFRLVVDVAEDLIEQRKIDGRLIGRKGWFLPQATKKLEMVWDTLEDGKINLGEISRTWGINEKRVFIALEDYGKERGLSDPVFYRNDLDLWLMSYLNKKYIDALASFDFDEDEVDFAVLVEKTGLRGDTRDAFEELAGQWLADKTSSYVKGSDNRVRRRDIIPELLKEFVPRWFEEEKQEITYEDIATEFGLTEEQAGEILQKLVDDRALGEVTLYPLDRKLTPRI